MYLVIKSKYCTRISCLYTAMLLILLLKLFKLCLSTWSPWVWELQRRRWSSFGRDKSCSCQEKTRKFPPGKSRHSRGRAAPTTAGTVCQGLYLMSSLKSSPWHVSLVKMTWIAYESILFFLKILFFCFLSSRHICNFYLYSLEPVSLLLSQSM